MDTTQKNRPAAPQSAQQRNGAARTAQAQRAAAGRPEAPEKKPAQQPRKEASATKKAPAQKKAAAPAKAPAKKKKSLLQQLLAPKKAPAPAKTQRNAQSAAAGGQKSAQAAPAKTQRAPQPEAEKVQRPAQAAAKAAPQGAARKPAAQSKQGKSTKQAEPAYTHGLPDSVSTKKRAYGNSKPKKKTARDMLSDAVKRSSERKAEKIKARQAEREKGTRSKSHTQVNTPAVIYTQPQAFNRSRFIVQMLTVVAVVVAMVMGLSVFFKVETITVSGAQVYSPWSIREASGIEEGDNLLTFSHARAGAQIKANLPYVKSVRFGIKLPDTVNIIIEEEDVVYAIKDQNGTWWLMNSSGRMVEQANSSKAANYTQILGVTVTDPVQNQRGVATESALVYETEADGSTVPVPVSVTGAQRLNAALQIVQALEENDIVGEAASVDVSQMEYIVLMYGTRFQVNLGDSTNIAYKIACMNDVILQMQEYQTGVLDISFTIWPNQVGYTPFS